MQLGIKKTARHVALSLGSALRATPSAAAEHSSVIFGVVSADGQCSDGQTVRHRSKVLEIPSASKLPRENLAISKNWARSCLVAEKMRVVGTGHLVVGPSLPLHERCNSWRPFRARALAIACLSKRRTMLPNRAADRDGTDRNNCSVFSTNCGTSESLIPPEDLSRPYLTQLEEVSYRLLPAAQHDLRAGRGFGIASLAASARPIADAGITAESPGPTAARDCSCAAHSFREVMKLFKAKLTLWVALSTVPGFLLESAMLPWPTLCPALTALFVGTFLCSSGASAYNQIAERHLDARMTRTATRPLPSGRLSVKLATNLARGASVLGVFCLFGTNSLTATLGAANILLYTRAYTPLKVRTPYNTHVGAVVGSIPTIMGCTAAGGSLLSPEAIILFTIQTLWQFPHFYGLAWMYREDYIRAKIRAFPLADSSGVETAKIMKPFIQTSLALPLITCAFDLTTSMFLVDGGGVNLLLWSAFRQFEKVPSPVSARKFFTVSVWHLLVILSLFVFHSTKLQIRDCADQQGAHSRDRATSTGHMRSDGTTISDYHLHAVFESIRRIIENNFCVRQDLSRFFLFCRPGALESTLKPHDTTTDHR